MLKKWIGMLLTVAIMATNFFPAYAQEASDFSKTVAKESTEREVALSDVSTKYQAKYGPTRYHVWADGVNLRSNHSTSATILEKIYADEWVVEADFPAKTYDDGTYLWIHVKREKTGTVGWMVDSYIDYD